MLSWLKKYFIPHEENDHQPHILRTKAVIFILAATLLVEAGFLTQLIFLSKTNLSAVILQNVLIDETNKNRQWENIPVLRENPLLDVAAKMKAEDMAAKGYFAHTSPEGITPWYWLEKAGYNYFSAGENLAVNFSDSNDVITAWLDSPTHRQNILEQEFAEIGIGIAAGTYEGRETIFIVQMFGTSAQAQEQPQTLASLSPVLPQPASVSLQTVAGETLVLPTSSVAAVSSNPKPAAGSKTVTSKPTSSAPVSNKAPRTPATAKETTKTPELALSNTEQPAATVAVPNNPPASALIQKAIASPRATANYIYAIFMALISISLLLNILIKMRIQHPHLVLNGLVMLLIINTVLLFNQYLSLASAAILE